MQIGQFVKVDNNRIGVVVANENSGGVFRGHCCIWFGETQDREEGGEKSGCLARFYPMPVVVHMLVSNEIELIDRPIGI